MYFGGDFQRAALIEAALEVVLRLEDRDVFVHGGERGQVQPPGNFLIARAVAVFVDEPGDEIEHLLLPLGECHESPPSIVGEQKGKIKRNRDCAGPRAFECVNCGSRKVSSYVKHAGERRRKDPKTGEVEVRPVPATESSASPRLQAPVLRLRGNDFKRYASSARKMVHGDRGDVHAGTVAAIGLGSTEAWHHRLNSISTSVTHFHRYLDKFPVSVESPRGAGHIPAADRRASDRLGTPLRYAR